MYRFLAIVLLSAPLAALAASADESFYKNAAEGGIAEVDAGKLAQEKGASQSVKDFGAMMVKDHSAANMKLESIASGKSVKLPTSASMMQLAEAKKMQMQSGSSFDESYMKGQIKAHKDTVELFQKEISSGKDDQAKQFAVSTLPTIQSHLTKIQSIAQAAGIKTE